MKLLRTLAVLPALALAAVAFAPAAQAQPAGPNNQQQRAITLGGLIDALIQVQANINDVLNDADILNNSLNNNNVQVVNVEDVLNGAQINVLSDILNNSEVLSRNDVLLQDFLNNNEVLKNFLNDANINVEDVIAIDVLDTGNIVIFVL